MDGWVRRILRSMGIATHGSNLLHENAWLVQRGVVEHPSSGTENVAE